MRGYSNPAHWNLHRCFWFVAPAIVGTYVIGGITPEGAYSQAQNANPTKPPTATASDKPASQKPLLKIGSQGGSVTELQGILSLLGYYEGTVNGTFDEKTAAAVTKFQKAANLTADGVVGADTWNRLLPPAPPVTPVTSGSVPQSAPGVPASAESFPMPADAKPNTTAAAPTTNSSTTPAPMPSSSGNTDRPQTPTDMAAFPILRLGMKGPAVEGLQRRLRALGFLSGAADGVFGPETQAAVKVAQRKLKLEPDGVVGSATWIAILQ